MKQPLSSSARASVIESGGPVTEKMMAEGVWGESCELGVGTLIAG